MLILWIHQLDFFPLPPSGQKMYLLIATLRKEEHLTLTKMTIVTINVVFVLFFLVKLIFNFYLVSEAEKKKTIVLSVF